MFKIMPKIFIGLVKWLVTNRYCLSFRLHFCWSNCAQPARWVFLFMVSFKHTHSFMVILTWLMGGSVLTWQMYVPLSSSLTDVMWRWNPPASWNYGDGVPGGQKEIGYLGDELTNWANTDTRYWKIDWGLIGERGENRLVKHNPSR